MWEVRDWDQNVLEMRFAGSRQRNLSIDFGCVELFIAIATLWFQEECRAGRGRGILLLCLNE